MHLGAVVVVIAVKARLAPPSYARAISIPARTDASTTERLGSA
jgi:hypothetical protein